MNIIDKSKIVGFLEIHESKDNGKSFTKIHEQKNLITNIGYKNITEFLMEIATAYPIGHFAVGNGSSYVSKADTVLDGEYERHEIDVQTYSNDGTYDWITNELNLASGEGNGTIRKLGLIAHGPTTTLANYNVADPDEAGHEWKLTNTIDVLLPNGKVKTSDLILKFIWKLRFG